MKRISVTTADGTTYPTATAAAKALVAREVPGFVGEYAAVAARMRQLGESRARDREVRGMR